MYDTYHYKYFRFFSQNWEVTLTPISVHFGFMSHQFLLVQPTPTERILKQLARFTKRLAASLSHIALHCIAVFEVRGALNFLGLVS